MYNWDFAVGVGLTISNDTQTASLDTAAFDANMDKLIALGYRELKLPLPGCSGGSPCGFWSAGSFVDPAGIPGVRAAGGGLVWGPVGGASGKRLAAACGGVCAVGKGSLVGPPEVYLRQVK